MRVRRDAVRVRGHRAACEVVALVDGDHEQCVALVDAVALQTVEEDAECVVVVGQLLLVVGLTRAGRVCEHVVVVRVGDVRERHGHAVLLHLGDLAERVLRQGTVEAGEPADCSSDL